MWVKVVKNNIGIATVRSGEDYDFEMLTDFFKDFEGIWSDINSSLFNFNIQKTMFSITSIISPCGNLIGKMTSHGISADSLQWIKVSSRSKMIVFLSTKNLSKTGYNYKQYLCEKASLEGRPFSEQSFWDRQV